MVLKLANVEELLGVGLSSNESTVLQQLVYFRYLSDRKLPEVK